MSAARVMGLLALGLVLSIAAALCLGAVRYTPVELVTEGLRGLGLSLAPALDEARTIILGEIRLPRVLLAALIGGGLALTGALLQTVFQNPMADASLLGVGSGAALGAVIAVKLGWSFDVFLALPAAAFVGALGAALIVYLVAENMRSSSLTSLILTGLAVSAFLSGITSIVLIASEEFRVRTVFFWLAGGLEGRGFVHLGIAAALVIPACLAAAALHRPLDLLLLGDLEARALGLNVPRMRLLLLALAALLSGATTSIAGSVPFVGLMAPHAMRGLVGPRSSRLLPAAFLAGAILVVLSDLAARAVSDRYDLPLGAITSLSGAPYLIHILRRSERA
ncbi:MAG TPA: iron ABC transporter permease [Vicinamibacteria bacterium]|nr:iron ABC transporter permease [Vicinamibacteria bacterium]